MMIRPGFAKSSLSSYMLTNALRFRSSNSAYLSRTPSSAGNRQIWTLAKWVKRGALGTGQALYSAGTSSVDEFRFNATTDQIEFRISGSVILVTTQVFRDPSAYMHVMVAVDTTQATGSNRVKLYINGTQVTAFATAAYPAQNTSAHTNNTVPHYCAAETGPGALFDGVLADCYLVDGQALAPTSFGQIDAISGEWVAKAYSGTYGTNGYHLDFADTSAATAAAIGKDTSGNGNNWTPSGVAVTDGLIDTPTNVYPVANTLDKNQYAATSDSCTITLANGGSSGSGAATAWLTVNSPNVYLEATLGAAGSGNQRLGLLIDTSTLAAAGSFLITGPSYNADGTKTVNSVTTSYGASYAAGDVIGVKINMSSGTIEFLKNNTSQGSISFSAGVNTAYRVACSGYGGTAWVLNFGQGGSSGLTYYASANGQFKYTPPTGFKALCTANMPIPAIRKPADYFKAVTYTGTGAAQSITAGFQPDLVWIKSRSAATDHALYDSVRGVQNDIGSNLSSAETTQAQGLTSFDASGFSLGALAKLNTNAASYVAWCWKKGATPGFDIVSYAGNGANRTIAHALGAVPKLMLIKGQSGTTDWQVYHASLANTEKLVLNTTAAKATDAAAWNSTTPDLSVFALGTQAALNTNAATYIAYLFAEIAGFSKFGSYTGNGSTDGPFVYCGFRPAFVLAKRTDSTGDWFVWDSARDSYNPGIAELLANTTATEATTADIDVVSNGFKMRNTTTGYNASNGTYIIAAFAEMPVQAPANAR